MCEWIDTTLRLPAKGKAVLFWHKRAREVFYGSYEVGEWLVGGRYYDDSGVTHWRPLPPPPAASTRDTDADTERELSECEKLQREHDAISAMLRELEGISGSLLRWRVELLLMRLESERKANDADAEREALPTLREGEVYFNGRVIPVDKFMAIMAERGESAEREAQRLDWRDASIALENAGCIGSSRLEQVQELIAQRDAAVKRMRQLEDEREALAAELIAWAADEDNVLYYDSAGQPHCILCGASFVYPGDDHADGCKHKRADAEREAEEARDG